MEDMEVCGVKIFKKLRLFWSKTNRWHRAFFVFLVAELNLVPGGQIGFKCNDPSLSHPYTGDTVNWKWLLITTLFVPLIVILIVERKQCSSEVAKHRAKCWSKEYSYGYLVNLTICQVLKLIVGAPRPHFFDTCGPEEAETCVESEYVSSYTCTRAHWLQQSNKSFPSGHTSLAIHAGVFIAYYLYRRARWLPRRGVALAQAASVGGACACAASRVWDRRHHWGDVLAGALLAAPVLVYTIWILINNFECPPDKDKKCEDDETLNTHRETKKST